MLRSLRVPTSFTQWIRPGDDATLVDRRKAIITELQTAVQDHRFDSETLEDITLILGHECLCWKYESDRNLSAGQNPGAFRHTLETSRTNQLVEQLSSCLVRSITPSSHYERELQSKALLSALALLHAQGGRALQANFYDELRASLAARFQDLQGVPGQRAVFTTETVRKLQCGYYLCLSAEYARHFRRAEPVVFSVVSSVVRLLILGASITSTAVAGTGPSDLQATLTGLERALRPFWTSPNELFQDLATLQELTRITIALHSYGEAMAEIDEMTRVRSQQCSGQLATLLLDKILSILDSRQGFQIDAGPRLVFLDYFVAFFNRGPHDLGRYFYQYGLLDCVSQLSGILSNERLSINLSNTLVRIIATSQEASYRWKCVEILMKDPVSRSTQLRKVPVAVAESNPNMTMQAKTQLQTEIKAIFELLNEEDGISPSPKLSIEGPQDVAAEGRLSPSGWIESVQASLTINAHAQQSSFKLQARCHKAGLSPNGSYAFFAGEKGVFVNRFPTNINHKSDDTVLHLDPKNSEYRCDYREAVLSNSFLAVLKETVLRESRTDSLVVHKYGSDVEVETTSLIATETFEATSNEPRWRPDCLAIHQSRDRIWIAVGGRSNQRDAISSTIRMYRMDINGRNFSKHDAHFHRFRPNPFTSDYIKSIAFGPDGQRLVCVTNNNRILIWLLSNNARPMQPPFQIAKKYGQGMNAHGATSATLFLTASSNPYVLCTTSPSKERSKNNGEWSYVSPVGAGPARVPPQLDHNLWRLRKAKAIIAGAASPDGSVIALLEQTGRILLMPLVAQDGGGLSALDPISLNATLKKQETTSSTALQFCTVDCHLCLVAVDPKGTVVRFQFQDPSRG